MSKHVLILEPSKTIQAIITEKTKNNPHYTVSFEQDGLQFLKKICDTDTPDAVLVNAKSKDPESMELIRFIKSLVRLRTVPVGIYFIGYFAFEQFFSRNCGADSFFQFDENTISDEISKLVALCDDPSTIKYPVRYDIFKSALTQHIFAMLRNLGSVKQVACDCISLIAEFCEVSAISLFFIDEGQPNAYFFCASSMNGKQCNEFLKVSTTDFIEIHPEINPLEIKPKKIKLSTRADTFHTGDVPLSSYHSTPLLSTDKKNLGIVNVVKEGNFTTEQLDLLVFCTWRFSLILEDAIMIKKQNTVELKLRKAFSRFVPEQIIDDLMHEAEAVDKVAVGEKRNVAILFSDIRSFTNISECNKPETIVAFLNRYFTIMVNIIKKHGGTIDKFIGDAIMALFGAPVSYEDNSRRAVAAAYEMREALQTVPLEDLVLPEGMNFNIGIGIHYGDVIVGSIGSSDKTDYSVIGDNVNLASRLEGLTKVYGSMILVSGSVKNDSKTDEFVFRHLDDVKVKGKAHAVPIFAVDKSQEEFSPEYRDAYSKGLDLYKQGVWNLALEYFQKAHHLYPEDKATNLMIERCQTYIETPPQNWDGASIFTTK